MFIYIPLKCQINNKPQNRNMQGLKFISPNWAAFMKIVFIPSNLINWEKIQTCLLSHKVQILKYFKKNSLGLEL